MDGEPEGAACSTLLDLPANVQATIVQEAGLHTRQVCRAFRDLHPPLLALAPHGLPTPEALTAALAALPPALTSLDLTRVAPGHAPVSQTHLASICTTLPNLQILALPSHLPPDLDLPAALAHSLLLLPNLHTLRTDRDASFSTFRPHHGWAFLQQPLLATRLRALSLPDASSSALLTAPPAAFPTLSSLCLYNPHRITGAPPNWPAANSAALVAAAPALRSLELASANRLQLGDDAPVAALTALTALALDGVCSAPDHPPAPLLQHIGTLTALRSLSLTLQHRGWTPAEDGWLLRLTQLTQLAVVLTDAGEVLWVQGGGLEPVPHLAVALASVARDAARLPLLRDLKLGAHYTWGLRHVAFDTQHTLFLHNLAAATRLRSLRMEDLLLLPSQGRQLTSLQQLTCLDVRMHAWHAPDDTDQVQPGALSLGWISSLRGLQRLRVDHMLLNEPAYAASCGPLQAVLTSLTRLHTLALLRLPPGHDLAAVLHHFEHTLVRLDLSDMDACYLPVLPVLGGMTRLQVLGLVMCKSPPVELAAHLRLPSSLRRCYLHLRLPCGNYCCCHPIHWVPDQQTVVAGWRRQYPLVDFCLYSRPEQQLWFC